MFYELYKVTRGDLAKFEDDGSWPVLIDNFMEYVAN